MRSKMGTTSTEVFFRKVPPEQVSPEKVRLAGRVLALVEKRLGLPPVEVEWCKEITESEYRRIDNLAALDKAWQGLRMLAGGRPDCSFKNSPVFADEDGGFGAKVHPFGSGATRIYINAGEAEGRMAFLVGHECKHLADWRDGVLYRGLYADPAVRQRLEDRADEFGREIEKELMREARR